MDTTTATITEFLLARITEDEAPAQHAYDDLAWDIDENGDEVDRGTRWGTSGGYEHNMLGAPAYVFSRAWSPERALAECRAKRRIVEEHGPTAPHPDAEARGHLQRCITCGQVDPRAYPCTTLRALAAVYDDHHDYRHEWRL